MEAMKGHRTIVAVQREACTALKLLCYSNNANRELIAACGRLDAILEGMKGHRTIADVQREL